ncbi:hypothetical protein QVD17_02357 [Tagetes erecta]|uniref:Uncharacterized protein n=1 Tax=Tagetes erecta TaxID=13708 RepID=A0AAD8P938_TARER|nr:hypothetical protein QVD17_02357 [Tagetes erecta]
MHKNDGLDFKKRLLWDSNPGPRLQSYTHSKGGGSGGKEGRRGGKGGARGRGWLLVVEIGEGREVRQRGWGEEERKTRNTSTTPCPARRRRGQRGRRPLPPP